MYINLPQLIEYVGSFRSLSSYLSDIGGGLLAKRMNRLGLASVVPLERIDDPSQKPGRNGDKRCGYCLAK